MKFRYARHTNDLRPLIHFYTEVIGLEVLGSFADHDNYDGVFLGIPGQGWHLEFTQSDEKAEHHFDADDLLVFYVKDEAVRSVIREKAKQHGFAEQKPKNPYWQLHGLQFTDPDGQGLIIALED